jgi:hypothetical protein
MNGAAGQLTHQAGKTHVGGSAGSGAISPCVYVPDPNAGPPPAGQSASSGGWYINSCAVDSSTGASPARIQVGSGLVWLSSGPGSSSRPVVQQAPPSPGVAAAQAASALNLPAPQIGLNPTGTGYVQLPEWLWVNPAIWHAYQTTAQACNAGGCSSATATAVPVSVTWRTGDGAVVVCDGPGVAYQPSVPAADQATDCQHTYTRTSLGEPVPPGLPDAPNNAAYPVTATVTWAVHWTSPGGAGGTLPEISTTSSTWLRVEQIEILRVPTP